MLSRSSMGLGFVALLGGVLIVPACDSGGTDDPAAAGSSNGGSSSGAPQGGSAGVANGGSAGSSAGSGGSSQMITVCPGVIPSSGLVADFNTAPAAGGKYEWGSAAQGTSDFWGGTFNYPAALLLTFADGAMTAAGHVTEYAGFGLYVQNCANASGFEGVRFKIMGNPPTGKLSFAVQTNKNEWATGVKGSCLAPDAQKFTACSHPYVPITVTDTLTTVEVKWAELGMGNPAASAKTDGSDIIGLQFILPWMEKGSTPYDASVTIDDVELIGTGTGVGAGGADAGGAGNDPGMAGAGGAK